MRDLTIKDYKEIIEPYAKTGSGLVSIDKVIKEMRRSNISSNTDDSTIIDRLTFVNGELVTVLFGDYTFAHETQIPVSNFENILYSEFGFKKIDIDDKFAILFKEDSKSVIDISCYIYNEKILTIDVIVDGFILQFSNWDQNNQRYVNNVEDYSVWLNFGNIGRWYLYLRDITNKELRKLIDEKIEEAKKEIEAKRNLLIEHDPIFLIVDSYKMSFKYIGHKNKKGKIQRFSSYGGSKSRFEILKKASKLLSDTDNNLVLTVEDNFYVFQKDILFTSVDFKKIDGTTHIKISNSLPEIPLRADDIERIRKFGLEYFEDENDYYSWELQYAIAE